jgi:hypothetical protein
MLKKILIIASTLVVLFCCYLIYKSKQERQYGLHREANPTNQLKADSALLMAKHGQLIFRLGGDAVSELFRLANQKDKSYSHMGIVLHDKDSLVVYHSIGGEDNPNQKIKKESINTFVNPKNNLSYALGTFSFTEQELFILDSVIKCWHQQERMFDMGFSLSNDSNRLYCSELLYKAINIVKANNLYIGTDIAKEKEYVAPENFTLHKDFKIVFKTNYTN